MLSKIAIATVLCLFWTRQTLGFSASTTPIPLVSPATGLPNEFYTWKEGQQIRYQCSGPKDGPPVLLVHGLFVNSDHWRKSLKELADQGYRTYALDLIGCGYSDKPPADSEVAKRIDGEVWRFEKDLLLPSVLPDISLGTAGGGENRRLANVDLRHPLQSPYNFYTWSDVLTDFTRDLILPSSTKHQQVAMVCNSIGTISTLQAVMDASDLYNGVFVVCPNFRELHSAEMPFPSISMPVLRSVQSLLRKYGQNAFDALAKPDTVKQILKEPYARTDAIDDTLVKVLLDPLLTPGASKVVFDTLSYSAGPLPEQQLAMFPSDKPVWVCYGEYSDSSYSVHALHIAKEIVSQVFVFFVCLTQDTRILGHLLHALKHSHNYLQSSVCKDLTM